MTVKQFIEQLLEYDLNKEIITCSFMQDEDGEEYNIESEPELGESFDQVIIFM